VTCVTMQGLEGHFVFLFVIMNPATKLHHGLPSASTQSGPQTDAEFVKELLKCFEFMALTEWSSSRPDYDPGPAIESLLGRSAVDLQATELYEVLTGLLAESDMRCLVSMSSHKLRLLTDDAITSEWYVNKVMLEIFSSDKSYHKFILTKRPSTESFLYSSRESCRYLRLLSNAPRSYIVTMNDKKDLFPMENKMFELRDEHSAWTRRELKCPF